MLTVELINNNIPRLQLKDSVSKALRLVTDFRVTHLPVVEDDKYLGLISEEDLIDAEETQMPIELMQETFIHAAVHDNEHFLNAVTCSNQFDTTVVPVVNEENELTSTVSYNDLLKYASEFMSLNEPGGLIVLEMDSNQYSFNEISKLVETNDAQITQLNTSNDAENGMMQVTIRINKPEISDIIATFQRYEYNVKYFYGEEQYANELKSNYDNLMNYLKI